MTDFNDGRWHGWNGEQEHPPIDPKSVVEVRYSDPLYDGIISAEAGRFLWGTLPGASIIAFRVTNAAPPKPREWWLQRDMTNGGGFYVFDSEPPHPGTCIHVREVIE